MPRELNLIAAPKSGSRLAPQERSRLWGLQAGRGLAAVAVVLAHSSIILAQPRFFGHEPFNGILEKFGAGVDFFFVLSGFIISWAHWADIGQPNRLGNFARRRFFRIYPAYWCVLIPLSASYALSPGSGVPSQHDPLNFVFSLLLLPYPDHPILGVAWTLVFEIAFYFVFAVVIAVGRSGVLILSAWALLVVITNLSHARMAFPLAFLADVHNLQFLIGIALAALIRRHHLTFPQLWMLVGITLFVIQLLTRIPLLDDPLIGRLGYGLSAALAMAGAIELERSAGLRVPRIMRELGSASYAIYLVHGVAISAAAQIVSRTCGRSLPIGLALGLLLAAGIVTGVAYYRLVERPLLHRLGRMN